MAYILQMQGKTAALRRLCLVSSQRGGTCAMQEVGLQCFKKWQYGIAGSRWHGGSPCCDLFMSLGNRAELVLPLCFRVERDQLRKQWLLRSQRSKGRLFLLDTIACGGCKDCADGSKEQEDKPLQGTLSHP